MGDGTRILYWGYRAEGWIIKPSATLYGFAPVGQIDIEYQKSGETLEKRLEQSFPTIFKRINEIIATKADDESEAFRLLRQITVPRQADIPAEHYADLITYVWDKLNFDKDVPYMVSVQGAFIDATAPPAENKDNMIYDPEKILVSIVKPTGLLLVPHYKKANGELVESEDYHWYMECAAAPLSPSEPLRKYQIPARNMRSLASIRRAVYQ